MFIRLIVDFLAYDDTKKTNDPSDSVRIKKQIEQDDASEVFRNFPRKVADGTVDEDVPLPDATTDQILIFSNQPISIKLNGSSNSLDLKPVTNGKKAPVYLMRGDVTDLKVSNSSGEEAEVDIILVQE